MTQPSALRQLYHGDLRTAEKQPHPSDSAWVRPDGEPSLAAGTAAFLGAIVIMVAVFQTLEWIVS